ncbi:MAG: dTMP kinase [Puniceicoccales bacterium]|jgi:dTMP kinase|nr:dTMP kinase [Puniceicoccales bacterium]
MSGIFVTFEGIEGCGKSTQLAMLVDWLQKNGHEAIATREPGGSEIGEKIRTILQGGNRGDIFSVRAEILLFEASRAQHMEEKILPALESGKIVLCDRFSDSTVVYQGAARGMDADVIKFLNAFAAQGRSPDFTVLIDVAIETGFRRIADSSRRRDRIEQEDAIFFAKARNCYLKLASEEERFFTVDGTANTEIIHGKIKDEFAGRFFGN